MMTTKTEHTGRATVALCSALMLAWAVGSALVPPARAETAVAYVPPPADTVLYLNPIQLDELVAPIALYPDELIGIVLPAAVNTLHVVEAARCLAARESDPELEPDEAWDDALVALLNYPDVIEMMNRDLRWTERLGRAVSVQQAEVIDAIARFRERAHTAGNLRTDNRQVIERSDGAIRIRPANPQAIYVPYYEPAQVLVYQPRPILRYYPNAYPAYYPLAAYYGGSYGSTFWGVGTLFSIGWSSRRIALHDRRHLHRPGFRMRGARHRAAHHRHGVRRDVHRYGGRDGRRARPGVRRDGRRHVDRNGFRGRSGRAVERRRDAVAPQRAARSTASRRAAHNQPERVRNRLQSRVQAARGPLNERRAQGRPRANGRQGVADQRGARNAKRAARPANVRSGRANRDLRVATTRSRPQRSIGNRGFESRRANRGLAQRARPARSGDGRARSRPSMRNLPSLNGRARVAVERLRKRGNR